MGDRLEEGLELLVRVDEVGGVDIAEEGEVLHEKGDEGWPRAAGVAIFLGEGGFTLFF